MNFINPNYDSSPWLFNNGVGSGVVPVNQGATASSSNWFPSTSPTDTFSPLMNIADSENDTKRAESRFSFAVSGKDRMQEYAVSLLMNQNGLSKEEATAQAEKIDSPEKFLWSFGAERFNDLASSFKMNSNDLLQLGQALDSGSTGVGQLAQEVQEKKLRNDERRQFETEVFKSKLAAIEMNVNVNAKGDASLASGPSANAA